jgi:WD40 repeat protein
MFSDAELNDEHNIFMTGLKDQDHIQAMKLRKSRILAAYYGGDVSAKLWNLDGSCKQSFSHGESVSRAVCSSDDQLVLTVGTDTLKLWSVEDGTCKQTFSGPLGKIGSAVFSTGDDMVLTGSGDGTAKLWSCEDGSCKQTFTHNDTASKVYMKGVCSALSTDNNLVLTWSDDDYTAKLWSAVDGFCIQSFEHGSEVCHAVLSADSQWVVTGADAGTAKVWKVSDGSCEHTFDHSEHTVDLVAISPDNAFVLTGCDDTGAHLWSMMDGSRKHVCYHCEIQGGPIEDGGLRIGISIYSAMFSPDGTSVLSVGVDGAKLWSVADGSVKHHFATDIRRDMLEGCGAIVAFSPDGTRVLTVLRGKGGDSALKVWSAEDGACKQSFAHLEFQDNADACLVGAAFTNL